MVAPYCFGYSNDDRSVSAYLDMLAGRAVEVDGVNANAPFAPPIVGLAESERVLAAADVVLVNSERERATVEAFRPRRPTFVVGPLPVDGAAGRPIGARVGTDPFALVHAPIWPEANQLLLARAALTLGLPLVLAGAVADPAYAERLREFAPDRVILLPEPDPATVAGLYRSASIVADAAWTARGHARLTTAAALGAAVVCSRNRWLELPEGGFWTVDPADTASIARGIGEAWDAAVRSDPRIGTTAAAARERLRSAAAAIVAGYAKIVQPI
jgi:glycosyltransferase involved in cell wall biosynthesis